MSALYVRDSNGNLIPIPSIKGDPYVLTEADKAAIVEAVIAALNTEEWTFTLESGSTVKKNVVVK